MKCMTDIKKTAVAAATIIALGTGAAQAATLEVYDANGYLVFVDYAVTFIHDTNAMTFSVSSENNFYGMTWTGSGGTLYAPGTYMTGINGDGSDELVSSPVAPLANGDGVYTWTVPAGSWGGNINFNWAATTGIDIFMVWSADGTMSLDVDGDGIPGARLVDGPFEGWSANFTPGPAYVPLPPAVWLFGSGLLGLIGVARRKKKK